VEAELCAFMSSRPSSFDLVNCADTLVYFGALEEAVAAARACLRPRGIFGFTVEAQPEGSTMSFKIHDHGRYSHSGAYLETTLRNAGFPDVTREAVVLRKERGEDVRGHLMIGRVPQA
jgi:predicted TPR repeat methyltransferase